MSAKTPQHEQAATQAKADSEQTQNNAQDASAHTHTTATHAQEDAQQSTPQTEAPQDLSSDDGAAEGLMDQQHQALLDELSHAQQEREAFKDQYLRARAEIENIRRRSADELTKARKFAVEGFAESLIPVRDSLEAALNQEEQSVEALLEGVKTTLRQLDGAFERHQLCEVAPQVGDTFDPHLHQAISNVPSDQKKGTVAQLLQKGYTLSDRVLRPAMVMVSAGPEA